MQMILSSLNVVEKLLALPNGSLPDEDDVDRALKTLERLGALTSEDEEVTPLGRQLAALPLAPRFGKMLVLGHQGFSSPMLRCTLPHSQLLTLATNTRTIPATLTVLALACGRWLVQATYAQLNAK